MYFLQPQRYGYSDQSHMSNQGTSLAVFRHALLYLAYDTC